MFLFGSDNARSQQHRATFKRLTKVAFLGNGVSHLFLLFPFLVPYSPFYCRRKTKENPTRINHPFFTSTVLESLSVKDYNTFEGSCTLFSSNARKICLRFFYLEYLVRGTLSYKLIYQILV